jgi:hypothetical protein
VTPKAIAKISADLVFVGLVACNGGKPVAVDDRVPANVRPGTVSVGGGGSGDSTATVIGGTAAGGTANGTATAGTTATMSGGAGGGTTGQPGIDAGVDAGVELFGAPLIAAPTRTSFVLSAVVARGAPEALQAQVRTQGSQTWQPALQPTLPAPDVAQWGFSNLEAGQRYEYRIVNGGEQGTVYTGSLITQRETGATFTFGVMTDSHIEPPDAVYTGSFPELTLRGIARDVAAVHPDFLINMGDMLDFHYFGFNAPPPDPSYARGAYLRYRDSLGDTLGNAAHFPVIGNWEGEDGFYTAEQIDRARSQRLLYLPGPTPSTYPESGSTTQDYYAFTWGDALFIVLNVMSYTTTPHLLSSNPGLPDDWTLGAAQMSWLQQTLEGATSKWRFLFIHHTVGGAAGNYSDSAYGRGGGQAAYVGEQAIVHELMLKHGVQIFFYGHDHVFTDMVVDGIHYTLPGSSGAPWKFTSSETGYTSYWTESGFGRVEVGPAAVNVKFVAAGGSVIYEYELR